MHDQSMSESDFKEWLKTASSDSEEQADDTRSESSGVEPSTENPGAADKEVKKEHVFGVDCQMCEDGSCH